MAGSNASVDPNGFSTTVRKILQVDENGYPTGASMGTQSVTAFNAQAVPANTTVDGPSIGVDGYHNLCLMINTTQAGTLYIQGSDDGVSWYDLTGTTGTALTWSISAGATAVPVPNVFAPFVRCQFRNTAGSAATVTLKVVAQY